MHQQKVYDCMQLINVEVKKIKCLSQKAREKMYNLIIADAAKKYGLQFTNVKIIFYGKTKL